MADGIHARTDGLTSLAGVIGVWLGFPLADPLVGLLIAAAIVILLWGTVRHIGRRLMDAVDPEITVPVATAEHLAELASVASNVERGIRRALPHVGPVTVVPGFATDERAVTA